MSLFQRKPIIIKGHTFSEYLSRCGQDYIMGRGEIIKDKSKLKPWHRYWEINGEYYQVDLKKELKIGFIVISVAAIAASIVLPIYFCVIAPMEKYHDYDFKYWNNAPALKTLKTYVKHAVTPSNKDYVPKEDRIATFDMDGTLYGERAPIYIEWLMFNDYYEWLKENEPGSEKLSVHSDEVPVKGKEDEIATVSMKEVYDAIAEFKETQKLKDLEVEGGKIVALDQAEAYLGAILFSDLTVDTYTEKVNSFLNQEAEKFNNLSYKDMFYKPMEEVVKFLQINNFNVYVVSGTDRFMVRTIMDKHLRIPQSNVIGMDVKLKVNDDGEVVRSEELIVKNVEEAKVYLITQEIGKRPVLSFGNSSGDTDMHDFALTHNKYKSQAYMVLADDNDREYAQPDYEEKKQKWIEKGYQTFSMKDDWKTIYGKYVTKK